MLGLQSKLNKSKGIKSYNSTNSMRFIPNNDHVIIPDHADFNHVNTNTYFTVSLWFKHDDGSPATEETLIAKYDTGANKREWRISTDGSDYIYVVISENGTSTISNVSTFKVDDTDWHHLYFRYDGSKTEEEQRVYMTVDGTQVLGQDGGGSNVGTPSASNYSALNEDDVDLSIGCIFNNGSVFANSGWDGRIDEVCYWKGHFHKGSSKLASDYCYNNGNPRDMRYAGKGVASGCEHIGYWKMGEFYNGGATVPDGTFPTGATNPLDSSKYSGGSGGAPLVMLNYAGGSPVRTGSNIVRNGDFSTAITECAVDEADNGVTATSGTDWKAGHTSNTGHTITNDTSVYYVSGRSVKLVTNGSGDYTRIQQTTTTLTQNKFYVLEFFWRSSTDSSNDGSQEHCQAQYEVDNCIEGNAVYGRSGNGNMITPKSKINQWHRVIQVGKKISADSVEEIILARNNNNIDSLAKTFWFDNISLYEITGTHHGLTQSAARNDSVREGVDR